MTAVACGVELNVGELMAALVKAGDAVPGRSPQPVLQNVLLAKHRLTASNGDLRIEVPVPYDGPKILLPHDRLLAVVRSCPPDATIELTPGKTACKVECGSSRWTLPTEDAESYPKWPVRGESALARLPADQFRRNVGAVVHAASAESGRAILAGVCIDVADGVVAFVATDGKTLLKAEAEIDQAVDDRAVVVNSKALEVMGKLATGEGAVQLEATGRELTCAIEGGATVTARLLEGKYPEWRKYIPDRDEAVPSAVDRANLGAAVRAARVCTDPESRGVVFEFGDKGLWLRSRSSSAGEASVTCDCVSVGQAVSVRLDPEYVTKWLAKLPPESDPTIEVEAVDGESAVLFRSDDFLCLVMPMT